MHSLRKNSAMTKGNHSSITIWSLTDLHSILPANTPRTDHEKAEERRENRRFASRRYRERFVSILGTPGLSCSPMHTTSARELATTSRRRSVWPSAIPFLPYIVSTCGLILLLRRRASRTEHEEQLERERRAVSAAAYYARCVAASCFCTQLTKTVR